MNNIENTLGGRMEKNIPVFFKACPAGAIMAKVVILLLLKSTFLSLAAE
jgi:hypothetical protein